MGCTRIGLPTAPPLVRAARFCIGTFWWWNGQWRLGKTNDYYYTLDGSERRVLGKLSALERHMAPPPDMATLEVRPPELLA